MALKPKTSPKFLEIFRRLHQLQGPGDLMLAVGGGGIFWGFAPELYPSQRGDAWSTGGLPWIHT